MSMDAVRKHTHYPSDPSRAKRPPRSASPTDFGGSLRRPLEIDRVFEVLFPQFQSRVTSSQNVVFVLWATKILSTISCRLHPPKCSRFLTSVWLPYSRCPTQFFVVLVQFLPVSTFNTFLDRLAECMPISINQRWSPSFLRNVINIDTRFFLAPTSSVLSASSSEPSLTDTSGPPSSNFGLRTSEDLVPSFAL